MTLEEAQKENYVLHDGDILSFNYQYSRIIDGQMIPSAATIEISIRQYVTNKKFRPCTILMTLSGISEFRIFHDNDLPSCYSDVTLLQLADGNYYVSFDPYGNTNQPSDEDNFVFVSATLDIMELAKPSEY